MAASNRRAASTGGPFSACGWLVLRERQDEVATWVDQVGRRSARDLARDMRLLPLVLIFLKLLEVDQRGLVRRISFRTSGAREPPVDEAAATVVEAQAQQNVGVLHAMRRGRCNSDWCSKSPGRPGPSHGRVPSASLSSSAQDRAAPLSPLADRQIDLANDQVVEPDEVW